MELAVGWIPTILDLGYSDDSFLLAPSLDSWQEMLNICEKYAGSHNLKFSSNPDPAKCKTKCMAFVQRERPLPQLRLCGNPLPWVTHGKHLGNTIENKMNGMKMDIRTKRANYIEKNNEIIKEFSYAHPRTRNDVNRIYNNHFTGSPLWDLFCRDADMMFNTWNKSVRLMFDVPLQTQLPRTTGWNKTAEVYLNTEISWVHFPDTKL